MSVRVVKCVHEESKRYGNMGALLKAKQEPVMKKVTRRTMLKAMKTTNDE